MIQKRFKNLKGISISSVILMVVMVFVAQSAYATNGYFANGYGVNDQALGGAGVALPQDSIDAAVNPANMAFLGKRYDFGLAFFNPNREYTVNGPGPLTQGTVKSFMKEFGRLKPCIHGSDAHSLDRIAKPDGGRFCWIKADPTFEGLRQIIFEPAERVFIGQEPPSLKRDHQVISSVQIEHSNGWFADVSVPLNPDLVFSDAN